MKNDNQFYELRTYFANPGMLEKLINRFERHTFNFFFKHNMNVIGLWLPLDNTENKLVYLLSFVNQEACMKSWEAFKNDSEWVAIKKKSSEGGELVASLTSVSMHMIYSHPRDVSSIENHVFEFRCYKNTPANQELLRKTFKNYKIGLSPKHRTNVLECWSTSEQAGTESNLLICLLVHHPVVDGEQAGDPIDDSLTDFIRSEYLRAASFSPLK